MTIDSIFIQRFADTGPGTAVAVKDLIDITGTVTTAGCLGVQRRGLVAEVDAACIAGIRAAERAGEAWIVGKTNLHELAFGAEGVNGVYGTPANPFDSARIPGGSSSGSAVALARGLADVTIGSDTGGSIRIPAACCGIVGLKTTWGRVPLKGVWPLAPFLDTIGPMGRTVPDVVRGMDLLEPGFATALGHSSIPRQIARVRPTNIPADHAVDAAIDAALLDSGMTVVDVVLRGWNAVHEAGLLVLLGEAWRSDAWLLGGEDDGVSQSGRGRLHSGDAITDDQLAAARQVRETMKPDLASFFAQFDAIALPTMPLLPPTLEEAASSPLTGFTRFANMTGLPALSLPVPVPHRLRQRETANLPASIQLIGDYNSEARLLQLGTLIEHSVAGN